MTSFTSPTDSTASGRHDEPPTLRQIDWLAVAPWLLIARAPAALIGWPLVFAGLGAVLLDQGILEATRLGAEGADPLASAVRHLASWPQAYVELVTTGTLFSSTLAVFATIGRALGWLVVGLLVVETVGNKLTGTTPPGVIRIARNALGLMPSLAAAVAMPSIAALLLAGGLRSVAWLSDGQLPALVWAVLAVGVGFPLLLLAGGALLLSPLIVAAIVIDRSDAFDAISRAYAYTLQRPFTLAWCLAFAVVIGIAGGALLEGFIAGVTTSLGALDLSAPTGPVSIVSALSRFARGYYPAYFFAAGAAIYLVMRHRVDGQAIDENATNTAPDSQTA
ncbi:hypothetical protein [Botrimarina hoheduenensis]|uniref:Uncharacterized protein n=1 Tax=Botrimarina hoheduenensis TaxID=2528000 RepID=A0A5C5WAV3_9BACT|nr:hypothetical protein [Botrimarina hoheduenensis]TWT47810.1 hypothetical protein Pla111_14330 [Botrimarina hoheduenensis]